MLAVVDSKVATSPTKHTAACVATWRFGAIAVDACAPLLESGLAAIDCVEEGIRAVETDNTDQYFVGVGGLPNAKGVMELDAAIMDSDSRYGAVMALQNIVNPISVARSVMEKCVHNVIVGDGALQWAVSNGFEEDSGVLTEQSKLEWQAWRRHNDEEKLEASKGASHDTIGLICLDKNGRLCAGTSTSGWRFKHPGRVGDAPLVGSGLYCDGEVGAAVATGDGEEIMRSCLSFLIVELMRAGHSPQEACKVAISRVLALKRSAPEGMHPKLTVAVIAMDPKGNIGAASTLSCDNEHRGRPAFPAAYWKECLGKRSLFFEAGLNGAGV